MKKLIVLLILLSFSCNDKKEETKITPTRIEQYYYAVLKADIPILLDETMTEGANSYNFIYQPFLYTGDIVKITTPIGEDNKYNILDIEEEDLIIGILKNHDNEYYTDVEIEVSERAIKNYLLSQKSKVVYRELFFFDSYKDASISRKEVQNNPQKFIAENKL